MTALAGLVPCADAGISTTSRCRLAAIAVVRADHHQAGELALRAGVRLQRHGRKAGDLAERRSSSPEDLLVALRLLDRRERMRASRTPGQVIGSISDAAFSFIVHEPSGIIDVSRPMSLRSRLADVAHHLASRSDAC